MNAAEAAVLLAKAAAVEGREVTEASARAWAEILADVPLVDALEWLPQHYREETRWLMPKHVLDGVTALQVRRIRTAAREIPWPRQANDEGAIVPLRDQLAGIKRANPLGDA